MYRYFELLENTLVIQTLPPFIFPQVKNIFKSRKLFFFDSGVVNRLAGFMSFEEVKRARFLGKVFENFVFTNFYAKKLNDLKKPDFFYFRDYQNHEIDLIYQRGEITIPVESSYSSSVLPGKLRNFSRFFSLHPKSRFGIIFYLGEVAVFKVKGKQVFAVPVFLI